MSMREKDSSDFDLEAFIDLFDEALTSDDPSVQKTLQHLMVIAALARNHDKHNARSGPLRRLFDDQNNIIRRLERLETGPAQFPGGYNPSTPYGPGIVPQPYIPSPSTPIPGTGTGGWPGPGPNQIWCGTSPSATSVSMSSDSATASQILDRMQTIANDLTLAKADSILKDPTYNGSTVG